ncbi:MAG TPA: isochorismatase family cysteine hydrolase [Steroidobacteraceae bacterium]|jgi:nicotinamidase-related amidase
MLAKFSCATVYRRTNAPQWKEMDSVACSGATTIELPLWCWNFNCGMSFGEFMKAQKTTPQGRAPTAATALVILDLISEYKFPHADDILKVAARVAGQVARLKQRVAAAALPVIYVNDTAGRWEGDQSAFVARCRADSAKGSAVVRLIEPTPADYFMFKPRHSGFYSTPLRHLLETLGTQTLILTGITSHQCVLFTAMDAYVRDYRLIVPSDCIGSASALHTRHALLVLQESLKAKTAVSASVRLTTRR